MIYFLSLILALLPAYLIRIKILNVPSTILELLIVVFLLVSAKDFDRRSLEKIKKLGMLNWAVILFVLAGVISTMVSAEKAKAIGQLKAFIIEPVLFFYAVVITVKTKEELNTVLRWLFVSAGAISLFGLIQYLTYINLPLRFWGNGAEIERITSVFDYPNALSLFLGPLIGFFSALWINKYPIFQNRWVTFAGLMVMTAALLLTFSRGAWIALAVGLFLTLLQNYKAKKVIGPAVTLLILLALIPSVRQRLSIGITDPSSSAHLDLIQTGVRQITQNPIFGNGLGGFAALNLGVEYPHNIILNFWVQTGLLGLIAFCWIVFLAFHRYKKYPQPLTLAAGIYLLIVLVHGLVDVPYFKNDLSLLFWFVVAAAYF